MGSLLIKLELCFSRWYRWIKDIEVVEIWMIASYGGVLSLWTDEITSRCSRLTLTDRLSTSCVTFSRWACRAWIESVCLWSWNRHTHSSEKHRNTETHTHTHTPTHTRTHTHTHTHTHSHTHTHTHGQQCSCVYLLRLWCCSVLLILHSAVLHDFLLIYSFRCLWHLKKTELHSRRNWCWSSHHRIWTDSNSDWTNTSVNEFRLKTSLTCSSAILEVFWSLMMVLLKALCISSTCFLYLDRWNTSINRSITFTHITTTIYSITI